MLENGLERCTCKKKDCVRHGRCEECLAHHRTDPKRPVPYCKRRKPKVKVLDANSD